MEILTFGIFTDLSYPVVGEISVDGRKGLMRDSRLGVGYANFMAHKFSRLDLTPLVSTSVKEIVECGKLCVDHVSCFSFNCAAFRDNVEKKILCQLLQSDKYSESLMFAPSPIFHHFSIEVSKTEIHSFWKINFLSVQMSMERFYFLTLFYLIIFFVK